MAKAVEHCIGKLVKGSGIEDALRESSAFGTNVVDAVINGSHYVRSLRDIHLKWEAFWASRGKSAYDPVLQTLSV